MKKVVLPLFSVYLISQATVAMAESCINPVGEWRSELGATVIIQQPNQASGVMKVQFKPPVSVRNDGFYEGVGFLGNTSTDADSHDPSKASTISFNVKMPKGIVSSFIGYCSLVDNKPNITSIWTGSYPEGRVIDHLKTNPIIWHPAKEDETDKAQ